MKVIVKRKYCILLIGHSKIEKGYCIHCKFWLYLLDLLDFHYSTPCQHCRNSSFDSVQSIIMYLNMECIASKYLVIFQYLLISDG